jgi:hypothetical protein
MVLAVDSHGNPNLNAFAVTPALAGATANLWTTAKAVGYPRGLYDPNSDWAPRLGITYRPFSNRQIVLRAGFGSYYNSFTGNRGASMINLPLWTQETQIISPTVLQSWDNVWPAQPVGIGNFFVNAPNAFIKPARTNEWNVSVQTALPGNASLTVAYVGNHSPDEISAHEYNVPAIGNGNPFPYPSFSNIEVYENLGKTWYNGLQTRAERRFKGGLSFSLAYAFSRSMLDKVSSVEYGAASIPFAPDYYTRSRSDVDRRNIESATVVWELPYGRRKRFGSQSNKFVDAVLGGWQLSFIQTAQSGAPLSIDDFENNLGNTWSVRARLVGNPHVSHPNKNMWFNTVAFQNYQSLGTPSAAFFALASPFGIVEGPGEFQINSGLFKSFHITESKSLQFRWETYNFTNRVNLNGPDTNFGDGSSFGKIFGSGPSRYMQFGLKFIF